MDYIEISDKLFDQLTLPYIYYTQDTIGQKTILARYIGTLSGDILLIPSSYLLSYSAVIAGLTQIQIEYIAKNAPVNYKKELANSMTMDYRMKEVFEIAKAMDEDLGDGVEQNQKRIKSVQQYILDNWVVFQF
jgi:hypothetical protein